MKLERISIKTKDDAKEVAEYVLSELYKSMVLYENVELIIYKICYNEIQN